MKNLENSKRQKGSDRKNSRDLAPFLGCIPCMLAGLPARRFFVGSSYWPGRCIQNENGMALALVLMISTVLMSSLLVGYAIMESGFRRGTLELSRDQVMSVAMAGVDDALSWFRSTTYGKPPIKQAFDPKNAGQMRGTTLVLVPETQDAAIGIVRDFPIGLNNNLFGHYEIKNALVKDITGQRLPGSGSSGLIWYIEANAAIYKRNSASVSYSQSPNQILRTLTMGAELRRMALNPPPAALTTYLASNIWIQSSGEVRNDTGAAIWHLESTGSVTNNGVWSGSPPESSISDPKLFSRTVSPLTVFGMALSELKTFVQNSPNGIYVNNSTDFSSKLTPYPSNSANPPVVYIEKGINFTAATLTLYDATANLPINASGVLVADGVNLEILGGPPGCGTNSCGQFTGLVYVNGTLRVAKGAILSGAVISTQKDQGAGGSQAIQIGSSSTTDPVTKLIYNNSCISDLNQTVGNYSISKAPYVLK